MRRWPLQFLVASAVLSLVMSGSAAAGDDQTIIAPPLDLGVPARAERVEDALARAGSALEAQRKLADALGAAGGLEAARGLGTLLRSRHAEVRVTALQALSRIAIRWTSHAEQIQKRLADPRSTLEERRAALAALGTVGDGRDMRTLLSFAHPDIADLSLRAAAYRAMAAMSGASIPYNYARWSYWWRKHEARGQTLLKKTIAGLEDPEADPALRADLEATLREYAWTDMARFQARLTRWLDGRRGYLEPIACRLAGELRIAAMAPLLARARTRLSASTQVKSAADHAARRLGMVAAAPAR